MDAEPRPGAFPIRYVVVFYLFLFFLKGGKSGVFGTCANKNEIMEEGKKRVKEEGGVPWQQQ